jgi:hypothetical protein
MQLLAIAIVVILNPIDMDSPQQQRLQLLPRDNSKLQRWQRRVITPQQLLWFGRIQLRMIKKVRPQLLDDHTGNLDPWFAV